MKIRKLLLLSLMLIIPLSVLAEKPAVAKKNQPFCWKVSDKDSTLYLLGSIHVGKPDMYPMAKSVEDAFTTSKCLFVEVDISKVDQQALLPLMMYQAPDCLQKHISANTLTNLIKIIAPIPIESFSTLRPGTVAAMIAMLEMTKLGYKQNLGVDQHFITKAGTTKKVVSLETAQQQLKLLNDLGEKFLQFSLEDFDDSEKVFNELIVAWKSGDSQQMTKVLFKEKDKYPEIFQKLFYERNITMTAKITKQLEQKGCDFVIVGAGHLVGNKGILKLLEKTGKYKIEQLK